MGWVDVYMSTASPGSIPHQNMIRKINTSIPHSHWLAVGCGFIHSSCHCRTQDMQYGIQITEGFNKPPLRLTLTMLRLLSFKAQGYKDFWNPSKILNPNGLSSQKVQFVLQSCLTQQKITDVKRLTNISDVRLLSKTFCCVEDGY